MSYRIVFTGNVKDTYVGDVEGKKLYDAYLDGSLPERFEVNGMAVTGKSVKAIFDEQDPDNKDHASEMASKLRQEHQEYEEWRKTQVSLPASRRAQNLGLARVLWQTLKGRKPTKAEEDEIIRKSEAWLEEHPDFHAASPAAYLSKEDIAQRASQMTEENTMKKIGDLLPTNALKLAERHLNA